MCDATLRGATPRAVPASRLDIRRHGRGDRNGREEIWRDRRDFGRDWLGDTGPPDWRDGNNYRISPQYYIDSQQYFTGEFPTFARKPMRDIQIVVRIARTLG